MTDAIKALRDYLSKSPSVVYPQDVLEYLPAIEAENTKLRELLYEALLFGNERSYQEIRYRLKQEARELGVEVD